MIQYHSVSLDIQVSYSTVQYALLLVITCTVTSCYQTTTTTIINCKAQQMSNGSDRENFFFTIKL